MKGFIIGLALGLASTAAAATTWSHIHAGIWCRSNPSGSTTCIPTSGEGYGVGISRDLVMVYNVNTRKAAFTRMQP